MHIMGFTENHCYTFIQFARRAEQYIARTPHSPVTLLAPRDPGVVSPG